MNLIVHVAASCSWYRADYRYGGRLQWGYHRGCAFVNESCRGWMDYAKDRYSCVKCGTSVDCVHPPPPPPPPPHTHTHTHTYTHTPTQHNSRKTELSPFCDERDWRLHREGCLDHRTRAGPCMLRNYSQPLPAEYQVIGQPPPWQLYTPGRRKKIVLCDCTAEMAVHWGYLPVISTNLH